MRRIVAALCVTAFLAGSAPGQAVRQVADHDIDRTIGEIQRFLWTRQKNDGSWEGHAHHTPRGGQTAFAVFALLESGVNHNDPRLKKAIDWLTDFKTNNTYVRTTRMMAFSQIIASQEGTSEDEKIKAVLLDDAKWLVDDAARAGAWGYGGAERDGDNSCSQFALMALWAAERANLEISRGMMRNVERTWLQRQQRDGGWMYPGQRNIESPTTMPMTAAGTASLYICQDVLSTSVSAYRYQDDVDEALAYLAKGLEDDYYKNGYLAFCIQRVGLASGLKFIGEKDWFAIGAGKLCEPNPRGRRFRGKYGENVRAAFELVFLARGRLPMTFNKLAYGDETDWNMAPRDLARFTEYMRRQFELRMRWQVVEADADVQLLLDAPVLYINGAKPLDLPEATWEKLREYTLRGGTLLFVPVRNSPSFVTSAREALEGLYADQRAESGDKYFQLRELPDDHPIYSAHREVRGGPARFPAWGVSDGVRELAVVLRCDLPSAWQSRSEVRNRYEYQMGVNFYMYAIGMSRTASRMRPVFHGTDRKPRHTLKVAWIKHGGNWDVQPYALDYLSDKLTAENMVKLEVTKGVEPSADSLQGQQLAWLVGSDAFELSDAEVQALRAWLDAGGTMFINAVGGSSEFQRSATALLARLYPNPGEYIRGRITSQSSLMTGRLGEFRGPILNDRVLRRTDTWRRLAREMTDIQLRAYLVDDREQVLYGPYGIHDTLDGHITYQSLSYLPEVSRDIAANIALLALDHAKKSSDK